MKKQLLTITAFCAACLVIGAQAQNPSDTPGTSGSSSSLPGNPQSGSSALSGSQAKHHWSAAGRMGHQEFRASQLMGANVTGSSGETLGTVSDTIINPASGRIDFAILSLNSASGAASTTPGTSSSGAASSLNPGSAPGTTSPGASSAGNSSLAGAARAPGLSTTAGGSLASTGGKQVAVPWMLLRPAASASSTDSSSSSTASSSALASSSPSGQQPSFVFTGESTKLQSAPNFDANTDLTQAGWRQSIFTYFGVSSSTSATGAAETPGSSSSGGSSDASSSSASPRSPSPGSSGSTGSSPSPTR